MLQQWVAVCCSELQCVAVASFNSLYHRTPPPCTDTLTSTLPNMILYLHCNTLQQTATHCNIPRHAATRRNTLSHPRSTCGLSMNQLGAVNESCLIRTAVYVSICLSVSPALSCEWMHHCNTLQHTATHCNTQLSHVNASWPKGMRGVWYNLVVSHTDTELLSLCLSVSLFLCLSVSLSLCFSVSLHLYTHIKCGGGQRE